MSSANANVARGVSRYASALHALDTTECYNSWIEAHGVIVLLLVHASLIELIEPSCMVDKC